jgi:transposase
MSLHAEPIPPVPEETARVARAALRRGNPYLKVRDELGAIYQDEAFAALFPRRGQPAEAPWRLALTTVLQFAEGLSDRQAADAVRTRIDWKYALSLPLTDPGFDHTVLSEFRARLVAGGVERLLLEALLARVQAVGLLRPRGRQRTDSTHVLAAVRVLNRLERVGETLRAALNALAVVAPDWLRAHAPAEWYERYGRRVENYNLPKSEAARRDLATVIGADGERLLAAIEQATELPWLQEVPAVQVLRRVWAEQYTGEPGQLRWREVRDMPSPAELVASPYDAEARYSTKHGTEWVGYKVHVTESCDPDEPHLITNVETTPATTPDDNMLAVVHTSLATHDHLPGEHLVDMGYTAAEVLLASQRDYGVTIVGPVADDPSWQARAGAGFDKSQFVVDWDRRVVTCPNGKQSRSWRPHANATTGTQWEARFAQRDCAPCPLRSHCTRATGPRVVGLQQRERYEALQRARQHQTTDAFRATYAARAGVEGTHAQAIRRCGLRHARYLGLARTHLQHIATAAAINMVRLGEWWAGTPRARTRCSPFAALRPPVA